MQSIKNTGVAIMLLFLSYGVYQVIMKPMPEQQGNANIDFSVTDPRPETESDPLFNKPLEFDIAKNLSSRDESSAQLLPPIQPPVAARETIPRELLQPQHNNDQGSRQMSDGAIEMNDANSFVAEFNPPPPIQPNFKSQDVADASNDFGNFQPKTELALNNPSATDASENQFSSLTAQDLDSGQYESTPLPPQTGYESQINSDPMSADTSVVKAGGLTDVAPRGNLTSPTETHTGLKKPTLAQAWPQIKNLVDSGNLKDALSDLSNYYRDTNLHPDERTQMLQWLDALAARVIYSTEHHLRSLPYVIQPGDTIATLARDWQIPAQLIYNVNTDKMPDPSDLTPGVEIKMIQGPFDAEIDSKNKVLTLFLDDMYAGRFTVGSTQLTDGNFQIVDKSASQKQGRPYWIQLNNGIAIYGSDTGAVESNEIALNTGEAEELFSILSATSSVRVLR